MHVPRRAALDRQTSARPLFGVIVFALLVRNVHLNSPEAGHLRAFGAKRTPQEPRSRPSSRFWCETYASNAQQPVVFDTLVRNVRPK
jgi:hypothetical protein